MAFRSGAGSLSYTEGIPLHAKTSLSDRQIPVNLEIKLNFAQN